MRSRRITHGKRRRRSALKFLGGAVGAIAKRLKKTEKHDIGAGVEVAMREPKNYAPTESEIHNPMEQASVGLARKTMKINRQEHI